MRTLPPNHADRQAGFTLVEVMVSLIVIAIGMLGIAKMQALALSSTGASRSRALAALEASSLAAAMHANRGYWGSSSLTLGASVPGTITISTAGTAPISPSSTSPNMQSALTAVSGNTCSSFSTLSCYCTTVSTCATQSGLYLAASDVYDWAQSLDGLLPNASATVTCANATDSPVDCTIFLSWTENSVSMNSAEATAQQNQTAAAAFTTVTYYLYVVP